MWLAACGDSTAPDTTRSLSIQTGDGQTGTVAQPLPIAPTVRVTNASGSAVSGVAVTFAVTQGGGSLGTTSATTGSDGTASAGPWTLGNMAGANTATAQVVGGTTTVSFNATGVAAGVAALAKVAGDAQTATVRRALVTAPTVRAEDAFGNPVANVAVTFTVTSGGGTVSGGTASTNAAGTATLGAWTLGRVVGAQTLTAAASTGTPAVFTATALEDLVQPSQDTTLSGGTLHVTRFVVPVGRVVTIGANADLLADSTILIAGTLQGDCRALRLISMRDVVVTGTVRNSCSTPTEVPPRLSIIASGGYDLRTATIESGGDIDITNDSTLTDADIPISGPSPLSSSARQGRLANGICGVRSLSAPPARNGTAGTTGTRGADARTWTLRCRGDLSIGGTIAGQDGGGGGNGTAVSGTANATGGAGGEGGKLVVKATGIVGLGPGATLRSGSGGRGGTAVATAQESPNGERAPTATALGGKGGDPGFITVRAGGGVQVSTGAPFELGNGGDGGTATATGARGQDGTDAKPAQLGGNANATGGDGGSLDAERLRAFGNVLGAPPVTGGRGGVGGAAIATAGKGGDGTSEAFKAGAAGGLVNAEGGDGGNSNARNLSGSLFAIGGAGGSATFLGGNGGNGWNGCSVSPPKAGGRGGNGGAASGGDGSGGTGLSRGAAGGVNYNAVSNGGKGGDGNGPGARGDAGSAAGVEVEGAATTIGTAFTPGAPGVNCGLPPGKGAVKVGMSGLPGTDLPATLGEIRRNGALVATITSVGQEVVLDPGTYQYLGAIVQPNAFRYAAAECTVTAGSRPANAHAAQSQNDDPCEFDVVAGELKNLVVFYTALNALVTMSFSGLPEAVVLNALWRRCVSLNPCSGPEVSVAAPGPAYILAGIYLLTFSDYVRSSATAVQTYRALPTPVTTLVAALQKALVVTWYLSRSLFNYAAVMAVKDDSHGHSPFVGMWLNAALQIILNHAPPASSPLAASMTDTPITLSAPAPFVTVTGVLRADGSISASGTGTVAGFSGVPVTFTGTMASDGRVTGDYQIGQTASPTGLPNGPIVYTLTGTVVPPTSTGGIQQAHRP